MCGIAALALVLNGCDAEDGSATKDTGNVSVNFAVSGVPSSPASVSRVTVTPAQDSAASLSVTATNGTLTITDIHLIVAEVELEPADGSCDFVENSSDDDSDNDSDGECPDFEAPPRVLNLPLDGSPVRAVAERIPAGTYDELEFEIEDLEDDEDDPEEAAPILALLETIRSDIDADWPAKASARVMGNFDNGSGPAPFRVFLEAEIEVEMDLVPNLIVAEDGTTSIDLTVDIRPDIWFTSGTTILDLSAWDYATTMTLLELEVEMEDGFTEIEIDDDDDSDDD